MLRNRSRGGRPGCSSGRRARRAGDVGSAESILRLHKPGRFSKQRRRLPFFSGSLVPKPSSENTNTKPNIRGGPRGRGLPGVFAQRTRSPVAFPSPPSGRATISAPGHLTPGPAGWTRDQSWTVGFCCLGCGSERLLCVLQDRSTRTGHTWPACRELGWEGQGPAAEAQRGPQGGLHL